MDIPTINEFNSWTNKQKRRYIEIETGGVCNNLDRAKGYFPFIIYEKQNVAIVYSVDHKGNFTETTAMTVQQAIDRLTRFERASTAVLSTN